VHKELVLVFVRRVGMGTMPTKTVFKCIQVQRVHIQQLRLLQQVLVLQFSTVLLKLQVEEMNPIQQRGLR
jgi:hypothetical protein